MSKRGMLISVEGNEGAGKTTIITKISDYFKRHGYSVLVTREPGGNQIAEQIRSVILDQNNTAMEARTEALLYAAARAQHWFENIRPALERGQMVICDRFIDSSLAYQGHARGIGIEPVLDINRFAIADVMPERTFYLDVDPHVGLQRVMSAQGREVNRLDLETMEFHQKVREGYLQLVERFPERIVLIDANQPFEHVFAALKAEMEKLLSSN